MRHSPANPVPGPVRVTAPPEPVRRGTRGGLALIGRTIAGALLLLVGAAMLVLPGPGLLVIAAGLSVLAVDYGWARRLRGRAAERLAASGRTIRRAVTARRGRRRYPDQQCDRPVHASHRDMRTRHSSRGAEDPATEVLS
jgi:Putative transmembrane protein (PGPGW)